MTHRPSWHTIIEAFCAGYGLGFRIEWDDHPSKRPDAVGEPGATQFAQLCADNVIAVVPDLYCLGSLSHEIGHAMVAWNHGEHKFGDEQLVSVEERAFLARLARLLLTERCGSTVWLPMSREAAEELARGEVPLPVSMRATEALRRPGEE